jgi:hypothetical protein
MNLIEEPRAAMSYPGHVKNGVIVLDAQVDLAEGLPVRVEPVSNSADVAKRRERYRRAFQLIEQWGQEDPAYNARLTKLLKEELPKEHGIAFRDVELPADAPPTH